jgi:hypothetical protein
MMTNATFVVVFCSSYETTTEDNNERASSLFSILFSCIAKDTDEPLYPSSSFAIQEKKKKTHKRMMSLLAHQHPLLPKKKNLDVGFS